MKVLEQIFLALHQFRQVFDIKYYEYDFGTSIWVQQTWLTKISKSKYKSIH